VAGIGELLIGDDGGFEGRGEVDNQMPTALVALKRLAGPPSPVGIADGQMSSDRLPVDDLTVRYGAGEDLARCEVRVGGCGMLPYASAMSSTGTSPR
jgi:hypothetical protein